jgi:CheY-like chemotaxis protein
LNARVLCCFSDQGTARGYEQALMDSGFSLLRARHGMHAYWLAIAAKPDLLVIDARDMDINKDYLLGRLQQNGKLAKMPILVITHQQSDTNPAEAPLLFVAGDILPSALATHVSDIMCEMRRIEHQNVDAFFSDLTGEDPHISNVTADTIRRTDAAGQRITSRLRQETQRSRSKAVGR